MPVTSELFDLTGKTAIVTGSGRGIGRALARGMAEAGARVTVCGRTADIVREVADELRAEGHEILDVVFDAQQPGDVAHLIEQTVSAFGALDIMVVNHGIGRAARAEDITPQEWDGLVRSNLTSPFSCARRTRS